VSDKRRGLGRGLGALIPSGPVEGAQRPVDVFFPDQVGAPPPDERDHGAEPQVEETESDAVAGLAAPGRAEDGGEALVPVPGARLVEIALEEIRPNARQPRQVFDDDDLDELARSIIEVGVLQPIVVRPTDAGGEGYELIMGERRWRAAQRAGIATIPAIVRLTPDGSMLRDALLENLHRAQLNPLEEAAAYQQLLEDFACTHEELATRVARSRPQISNTIRLLKLPGTVQRRVAAGVLSAGHARALLGLPDGAAMERIAQRVVAEGLSVRATEEIVALGEAVTRPTQPRRGGPAEHDAALGDLANRLSDRLDTRVRITLGQRRGRIAIEFASVEDLQRILDVLSPGGAPADEEVPLAV
jgi:ParB family chromosome partitioning protein